MPSFNPGGKATSVKATGYTAVTSGNAAIIGVMCHSSGTAACSFYTTAAASGSVTIGGLIRFNVTVSATIPAAIYLPFPADAPGGFSVNLGAAADPNITIFWNPA